MSECLEVVSNLTYKITHASLLVPTYCRLQNMNDTMQLLTSVITSAHHETCHMDMVLLPCVHVAHVRSVVRVVGVLVGFMQGQADGSQRKSVLGRKYGTGTGPSSCTELVAAQKSSLGSRLREARLRG